MIQKSGHSPGKARLLQLERPTSRRTHGFVVRSFRICHKELLTYKPGASRCSQNFPRLRADLRESCMDQSRPEKSNERAADYSPCPLASPGGHAFCGCRNVNSLDDAIEPRISGAFARSPMPPPPRWDWISSGPNLCKRLGPSVSVIIRVWWFYRSSEFRRLVWQFGSRQETALW